MTRSYPLGPAILFWLALGSSAPAGELVLGFGLDDIDGSGGAAESVQVEYHSDPLATFGRISVSALVSAQYDANDDFLVAAGLSSVWNVGADWFVEGSLAAGYAGMGRGGNDLGGTFQFRSLVGLGYRFDGSSRISLAIDHVSNGGLQAHNPGRNAVFLRYGIGF